MGVMMIVGLVVGLVLGITVTAVVYGREMRRMARFLNERPAGSNSRLDVQLPGSAFRELARAINGQLDAIQSERIAMMTKTQEFQRELSALAHDVRTPLMGAQGHIQLALDEHIEDDHTEQSVASWRRHLTVALHRLDDMHGLLDQLFAYARANDPDQTLDVERVELYPLIAEVLVGHYPEFEEHGWEPSLQFDDQRFALEADATALRRIVDNLITNALRHGSGAPVVRQHGDTVTFANPITESEDESIDPAQLFDRFYQADDARGKRGSGLGLAVAQSLAHAMHLHLSATVNRTDSTPSLIITLQHMPGESHS